MRDPLRTRLLGLALSLIGIIAILWLGATGQLALYIHPRYFVFTMVMASIAAVVVAIAIVLLVRGRSVAGLTPRERRRLELEEAHAHDDEADEAPTAIRWKAVSGIVLVVATGVALLVLPPTTLTTSTVEQRDMNDAASVAAGDTIELAGADTSAFTVKDWAAMLRQGGDAESFAGMEPTLLGFVTPDPDDPANVFYVARFTVTCCAVDAQPVGVPVHLPGWQDRFAVDSWVEVSGPFVANPSAASAETVVVEPLSAAPAEQPANPYVT